MDYIGKVREFHVKMALENPFDLQDFIEPHVRLKRIRLMAEECGEVIQAMDEGNLIEIADGCADLVYVVAGTGVVFGIPRFSPALLFEDCVQGRPTVLPRGRIHYAESNQLVLKLIDNLAMATFVVANVRPNIAVSNALHQFVVGVWEVAYAYGIPFNRIFEEVHRSNMTKTPLNEHRKGGKGAGYEPPRVAEILGEITNAIVP